MGGKAHNDDLVLFREVAETVSAVGVVAVEDKETVAATGVPCSSGRFKIAFEPLATKFLVRPAFRGV